MLALADDAPKFPFKKLTLEVCSGDRAKISILWVLDNLAYFQFSQGQRFWGCFSNSIYWSLQQYLWWNYGNVASSHLCGIAKALLDHSIYKIEFKDMITKIAMVINQPCALLSSRLIFLALDMVIIQIIHEHIFVCPRLDFLGPHSVKI